MFFGHAEKNFPIFKVDESVEERTYNFQYSFAHMFQCRGKSLMIKLWPKKVLKWYTWFIIVDGQEASVIMLKIILLSPNHSVKS